MTYIEKVQSAIRKSEGKIILDCKSGKRYKHGENPYYDMAIENCIFCDLFPEEIKNNSDFYGFNRSQYKLMTEQAAG